MAAHDCQGRRITTSDTLLVRGQMVLSDASGDQVLLAVPTGNNGDVAHVWVPASKLEIEPQSQQKGRPR